MSDEIPSVYVVEDEPVLYERILGELRSAGYRTKGGAIDAEEAYRNLHDYKYDLSVIVLDLDIVGIDSIGYSKMIKRKRPDVKFVFFTMHEETLKKVQQVLDELDGVVIRRPFSMKELSEAVKRVAPIPVQKIRDVKNNEVMEDDEEGSCE